jgi:hypothetical protein
MVRSSGETRASAGRGVGIAPCVAITRELGASAGSVAARVAAQLGYTLWGDELMGRVAHKLGVNEHALSNIEARRDGLLELLRAHAFARQSAPRGPSGAAYRLALSSVVDELCAQGGAVIVGRGAALLVRPEQALRVRIVCPLALRVERHQRRFGLDRDTARRRVLKADADQVRFLARLTGNARQCASAHDIVLSTAELSADAVAQLIVSAYGARFTEARARGALKQPAQRVEEVLQ